MLAYLVQTIRLFLPAALLCGAVPALWREALKKGRWKSFLAAIIAGLVAGPFLLTAGTQMENSARLRLFVHGVSLVVAVPALGAAVGALWKEIHLGRSAALLFLAVVAGGVSLDFSEYVSDHSLSATSILNAELIANLAGILVALSVLVAAGALAWRLSRRCGKPVTLGLFAVVSALLGLGWTVDLMLELMRAGRMELSGSQLSFAAKINGYEPALVYVALGLLGALTVGFFFRRERSDPAELERMSSAERRKARVGPRAERRWLRTAGVVLCLSLASLLYYDLWASRGPALSEPKRIEAAAGGRIRIPVENVSDGSLHRYSYVTGDGHVIRFFLINRSRTGADIATVFDACMLCGPTGYLQEGEKVICKACDVSIFIPTIGRAGGCNPIPFAHEEEDETVLIETDILAKGTRFFPEVVTFEVTDPVTGATMTNREAPYQYEHEGRTYYFENDESREKFRENSERYAGGEGSGR